MAGACATGASQLPAATASGSFGTCRRGRVGVAPPSACSSYTFSRTVLLISSVMNATSFQVPVSFVRSSPKHDEPWSSSPVVNAAQIKILLLVGHGSPLAVGCNIHRLLQPR